MGKNRSGCECLLQEIERGATSRGEIPRSVFVGKLREWYDNVGVVVNETMVEVCETEEGLDVLHLAGFRPIRDGFHLICRHGQSIGGKAEPKVFSGGGMELTFLRFGKEIVFPEVLEDFVDMLLMGFNILRIYEDVIQIDDNADIE